MKSEQARNIFEITQAGRDVVKRRRTREAGCWIFILKIDATGFCSYYQYIWFLAISSG
jgi:hypothetical protein